MMSTYGFDPGQELGFDLFDPDTGVVMIPHDAVVDELSIDDVEIIEWLAKEEYRDGIKAMQWLARNVTRHSDNSRQDPLPGME